MKLARSIQALAALLLSASFLWSQNATTNAPLPAPTRGGAPVAPPPGSAPIGARGRANQAPVASASASAVKGPGLELPALNIDLTQISESRNSAGSGSINLTLSVTGNGLPPGTTIRTVTITKAADHEGKLITLPPGRGRGSSIGMMMSGAGMASAAGPLRATANMSPISLPRSATGFSYIEGTLEVFAPSEATGSIVRVPNITSHIGRVEHPALQKHGIAVHFIGDADSLAEVQSQMTGTSSAMGRPMDLVSGYGIYTRDPASLLSGVHLADKAGNPLRTGGGGGGGSGTGMLFSYTLTSPLPADAQLVLNLAIPEATVIVPFRIENIDLP